MEYKLKEGMIDNRMVKDDHQQGIKRVIQRKSDYYPGDCEGHQGYMGPGWGKKGSRDTFKRGGGSLTPRKA